jgi:hypothetical protein
VRFRLSIGGLLFAWLCASGGLLDVAQVFAWARMCAGYAQIVPLREAVVRTFDPNKPCEICTAVINARHASSESRQPAAVASVEIEKILLIACHGEPVVVAPVLERWPVAENNWAPALAYPVPVPPPRGGAVSIIG